MPHAQDTDRSAAYDQGRDLQIHPEADILIDRLRIQHSQAAAGLCQAGAEEVQTYSRQRGQQCARVAGDCGSLSLAAEQVNG